MKTKVWLHHNITYKFGTTLICFTQIKYYRHNESYQYRPGAMAYIRCQNYILLLTILLCDIDITFCNMHGLFCYVMSHYAIFILYYAK